MRYQTYLEEPSMEKYRLEYSPRDGYGTILVGVWVVVTGASGATYNSMRGLPLPANENTTVNFGTYRGSDDLDGPAPLVFSFEEHPVLEHFRIEDGDDGVIYAGTSFKLALNLDAYRWTDANGKIDLCGQPLGKACTFWAPQQDGFEHPIMARSHLAKVTGEIDGDPVEGVMNLDFYYGTPGISFRELGVTSKLHNYWMNWLVEYDDGTLEGGFAWRGMPGLNFAAAHHYVGGRSHARADARIDVERISSGAMQKVTLSLGDDLVAEFRQHGSLDWPLHTYGTVDAIPGRRHIVKSWNYSENFPLNWKEIEDYQYAYAALHGRLPSLRTLLHNATVLDGKVIPFGGRPSPRT